MSKELNLLLEEIVESEVICNRKRQIYNELENILIRKDYLQKDNLVLQLTEPISHDVATNSSNRPSKHNLVNNNSRHKLKSNCSEKHNNSKRCQLSATPDNKDCFAVLQNKIHQFESYKNSFSQARNKYATEFLSQLEIQNEKLSRESLDSKSDSC